MIKETKCPICNKKIDITSYSGPYGTEEEYINCDRCNYNYEFAYGHHKEMVHNKLFVWSYVDCCLP